MKEIVKLSPHISRTIWGGKKLERIKNIDTDKSQLPVGETWEVSIHPKGECHVEGKKLSEYCSHLSIPYLVKFIDTADNLSVQVHPDDEFAQVHENDSGKTECWIILDVEKNDGIYLGVKEGVTKEKFEKAIEEKDNLQDYLNFYSVKPGDFFWVPAGTIHAIGKGVTLAEVQQSSGVTYRVWDWNRVDSNGNSRELHVEKALKVSRFENNINSREFFKVQNIFSQEKSFNNIVNHDCFSLNFVQGKHEFKSLSNGRNDSIVVLEGKLIVKTKTESLSLEKFECAMITQSSNIYIEADEGTKWLLVN